MDARRPKDHNLTHVMVPQIISLCLTQSIHRFSSGSTLPSSPASQVSAALCPSWSEISVGPPWIASLMPSSLLALLVPVVKPAIGPLWVCLWVTTHRPTARQCKLTRTWIQHSAAFLPKTQLPGAHISLDLNMPITPRPMPPLVCHPLNAPWAINWHFLLLMKTTSPYHQSKLTTANVTRFGWMLAWPYSASLIVISMSPTAIRHLHPTISHARRPGSL